MWNTPSRSVELLMEHMLFYPILGSIVTPFSSYFLLAPDAEEAFESSMFYTPLLFLFFINVSK